MCVSDYKLQNKNNKVRNILIYTAAILVTLNNGEDLFRKIQDHINKNYVEEDTESTVVLGRTFNDNTQKDFEESIFSQSILDIIKYKGGFDSIPETIYYQKPNNKPIDISHKKELIATSTITTLRSLGKTKTQQAYKLLEHAAQDYKDNKEIFCTISSEWINILDSDDYWTKVAKIQKYVRSLGYERDLFYLGKNGDLAALGDYQLPALVNLIIGSMDCNNKTGLFVELCWANDILVGIGMSATHAVPIVYTIGSDKIRKAVKSNTSFVFKGHEYRGIVVDPTMSDLTHKQARPRIAGDIKGDAYKDMQYVIIQPQ